MGAGSVFTFLKLTQICKNMFIYIVFLLVVVVLHVLQAFQRNILQTTFPNKLIICGFYSFKFYILPSTHPLHLPVNDTDKLNTRPIT